MTGGTGIRLDSEDDEVLRRLGGDLGAGLRDDDGVAHPDAEGIGRRRHDESHRRWLAGVGEQDLAGPGVSAA